jgi:OmpA-OmpF porin, OOP family
VVPVAAPAAPVSEKVTFAADAFFDTNKSVLKKEAGAKLDDLVSKVKAINLEVIIAVGHTDSDGSDKYNQKLSVRRAEAVKKYLVSKGIEPNRVYTEGKGEKQPVADNKTKEGKAKNRRVEIEVVGTRTKK